MLYGVIRRYRDPHTHRTANGASASYAAVDTALRAVGYVRVSTEQSADSGLSIEAQRRKLEARAVVSDYQVVGIVEDAGASAKTLDRPGWSRVADMVSQGNVDVVMVSKLDRCTHSVADLGTLLDQLGKARRADGGRGVALVSCAESLDTSTAAGRLVVNVLGAVSRWEREAIGERTSAALQEKRSQGRSTGGVAPYGFRFANGVRVAVAAEQQTLDQIDTYRAAGLSWARVATVLNDAGRRTRTGGLWTRQGAQQVYAKATAA